MEFGMFHEYYQVQRLIHWWRWDDLNGSNYQQYISTLALGSGGTWGEGLGNSRMKLGFLPEAHTDFILPIIGEELGLIGAVAVVFGFAILCYAGVRIALTARDTYSRLLAGGLTGSLAPRVAQIVGQRAGFERQVGKRREHSRRRVLEQRQRA